MPGNLVRERNMGGKGRQVPKSCVRLAVMMPNPDGGATQRQKKGTVQQGASQVMCNPG